MTKFQNSEIQQLYDSIQGEIGESAKITTHYGMLYHSSQTESNKENIMEGPGGGKCICQKYNAVKDDIGVVRLIEEKVFQSKHHYHIVRYNWTVNGGGYNGAVCSISSNTKTRIEKSRETERKIIRNMEKILRELKAENN